MCGGQMRLIAFMTDGAVVRMILEHIGVDAEPPRMSLARGQQKWGDCDVQTGLEMPIEPDWDLAAQAAPDYEIDQRVNG